MNTLLNIFKEMVIMTSLQKKILVNLLVFTMSYIGVLLIKTGETFMIKGLGFLILTIIGFYLASLWSKVKK